MYAKIFQKLLQNFFLTRGRAPMTPNEWSKLRRQAMELARKEGGDPITGLPSISSKTTIEDLMTGPHNSQGGPKGDRIWDFSKDLPTTGILQKRGNIIPFPKGRRTTPAVKAMMHKGDIQVGKAPKTLPETLKTKKDRHILFRDAEEDILRIKRENKQAVEDFKRKFGKNDDIPEFAGGGIAPLVGEPSYSADFYDDRTPYATGNEVYGPPKKKKKKKKKKEKEEKDERSPKVDVHKYADPFWHWGLRLPAEEKPGKTVDPTEGIGFDSFVDIDVDMSDPRLKLGKYDPEQDYHPWEFEIGKDSIGAQWKKRFNQGGRIGLAGGGALFKFIEKLFIKASNDIRLGRGKFKGLDQKQRIVQHDNLTKKVREFQKSGNTEGLEVYFDVNPNEAFAAAQAKVKKTVPEVSGIDDALKSDFEVMTKTDPLVSDDVLAKAYDEVFYQKPASGDYKYDADVLADSIAEQLGKGSLDDFSQVQQTEIYNSALKRVQQDLQINRAKKIAEKNLTDLDQKIELQMFDPKDRLPNQSGGPVDHDALVQMYIAEGLSYEEAVQAAQSAANLPWDTLKKAEGGIIRAGFPFGGRALKAIMDAWRANKIWGVGGPPYKPEATSFNVREMTKRNLGTELSLKELKEISESPFGEFASRGTGRGPPKFEEFNKEFKNIKARILKEKLEESKRHAEAMIESADHTIKNANQEFNKAFGPLRDKKKQQDMAKRITDQFTREGKKQLEESKEGLKAIDLYMGMLQKKGRKLHAEGGRVSYSGGGRAGLPAITYGMSHPGMQGLQMPMPSPQPAGIPGGTIVASNQMQQSPWMGPQMQQGPGGMPRPMAAEGGRIGFGLGGMSRRAFMKLMAGAAALPFVGKGVTKVAPKAIPKVAAPVATAGSGTGMPAWFPAFVQKVLKEGKDLTPTHAPKERVVVAETKLPKSDTPVYVEHDITTGDTMVHIGQGKHGWSDGYHGQPTSIHLKKGEIIEEGKMKGQKEPDEFVVEEAEFTGGHPENIKFEESSFNNYGEHGSDFRELEEFATGKVTKDSKPAKQVWEADWDDSLPDYEDYASGGLAYALGE